MANALIAILCGLLLLAGWFYLTRSRLVEELNSIESPRRNRIRRKVRRLGAMTMIALAIVLFVGVWMLMGSKASPQLMLVWLLVVILLLFILILSVMVDIYLTARMRGMFRKQSGLDSNAHEEVDS